MAICDFCSNYKEGKCTAGLDLPKGMTCRDFQPGLEKFCADPTDFVNCGQIVQMATFFGIGRTELKKVRLMALREESQR